MRLVRTESKIMGLILSRPSVDTENLRHSSIYEPYPKRGYTPPPFHESTDKTSKLIFSLSYSNMGNKRTISELLKESLKKCEESCQYIPVEAINKWDIAINDNISAMHQVIACNLRINNDFNTEKLKKELNNGDFLVQNIYAVNNTNFKAKNYSSVEYQYMIPLSWLPNPDLNTYKKTLRMFNGTFDFHNFCGQGNCIFELLRMRSIKKFDFLGIVEYNQIEYAILSLNVDEIRPDMALKIISLALCLIRGIKTKQDFIDAFSAEPYHLESAPKQPLFISFIDYEKYIKKTPELSMRFTQAKQHFLRFRDKYIIPDIASMYEQKSFREYETNVLKIQ